MGNYTASLTDSEPESESESNNKPSPTKDEESRMCTPAERKKFWDAMPDSPEPEPKALPPSTRPGPKEPRPGQAVEVFSEDPDKGNFKETKEEENLPLNVVQCWAPGTVGSSKDHAPSYEFGNRPAIFKAEGTNANTREGYQPALFRLIEAPTAEEPTPGGVEEVGDDGDSPGGSGGGDAPGGSGAGGADGGSRSTGGSGGAAGGGDAPPAV